MASFTILKFRNSAFRGSIHPQLLRNFQDITAWGKFALYKTANVENEEALASKGRLLPRTLEEHVNSRIFLAVLQSINKMQSQMCSGR